MACSIERYTPGNPVVVRALEGSTQTYLAGDPVRLSAGYVIVATAGNISGIAKKDWALSESECEVELIDPNAVYSVRCGTLTHAQTLVGTIADFIFTTPGEMTLEAGTTDVYIVGLDPRDAIGTTYGRVLVRFKVANYGA